MSVDLAHAAYNPSTGQPFRVADNQARGGNFAKARELLAELKALDTEFGEAKADEWNLAREEARYTVEYAVEQNAAVILWLKELRRAARAPQTFNHTVPTGRYAVDNNEGHTAFYRVVVGDHGHTKVQVYSSDKLIDLDWNRVGSKVIRKIEEFGIHAAKLRFAHESERCYRCNRRLTDETSRARGTGDDCAEAISAGR